MTTGSALYQRAMAWYDANDRDPSLQHKVWDPTPWMLDVNVGACDDEREIWVWCDEHLGDESSPLHGRTGTWHRGNATVHGWTWFGFDTKERMRQFQDKWGGTDKECKDTPTEEADK